MDVLGDGGGEVEIEAGGRAVIGVLLVRWFSYRITLFDDSRTRHRSHRPSRSRRDRARGRAARAQRPVRLRIVAALAATARAAPAGASRPVTKSTCTHHFKVLREAGVIPQRQEGTTRLNTLRREDPRRASPACSPPFWGLLDRRPRPAGRAAPPPGMTAPRNLVNLKDVAKGYGSRTVLRGRHARRRRGRPDRRRRAQRRRQVDAAAADRRHRGARRRARSRAPAACALALLGQGDDLDPARTIRDELVGGRADHEWAADARFRDVLDGLLGGVELRRFPQGLDTPIAPLSGGERRRIALAAAAARRAPSCCCSTSRRTTSTSRASTGSRAISPPAAASMLVVTHDRWFLDAVCTAHVGGRRRRRAPVRGRLRGLRARPRRARRGRPPRARSAASSCCARSSPGCGAGRRRARPSRSSGSRPPTR